MGDVYCRQCGEPWDYLELRDNEDRWEEVLYGEGCPACDWGEKERVIDRRKPERKRNKIRWMRSIDNGTDLDPIKYIT